MKIAVIGSGAMGQLFGARLQHAGEDVSFIDVYEPTVKSLNDDGLHIITETIDAHLDAKAFKAADLQEKVDFALVFTKGMYTRDALASAKHIFTDETVGLTLQNGLGNGDPLLEVFGPERTLVGVTDYSADRDGNTIKSSDYGHIAMGDHVNGDKPSEPAHRIFEVLKKAGFDTGLFENVHIPIWEKLIFNTAVNTIGGATGMTLGQTGKSAPGSRLLEQVLAESLAVARAEGVAVREDFIRGSLNKVFHTIPEHKTSMTADIDAGRPTEIETIGGAIEMVGRNKGVPTPVLSTLCDVVRARSL